MTNLTTPQAAAALGIPVWLARRLLDGLEGRGVPVPRHGPYRVVTPELLRRLRDEVERLGRSPAPRNGSRAVGGGRHAGTVGRAPEPTGSPAGE
jgi:hypothetical protein